MMRKLVFASVVLLMGASASAIDLPLLQKSARMLEDAQYAFDSGEYGQALLLAEEAKLLRQQEVDESLSALTQALRPMEVQDAGDDIQAVMTVLRSRDVYDVVSLIEYMVTLHGESFFGSSIYGLLEHLEHKRVLPEASHLMAKIYEYEGEYDLAYSYYEDAWTHAAVLDIPQRKFDILYDMANLSYNFSDYENCEKALMLIVASDPNYANESFATALTNSVRDKMYSADKVFDLYRSDCYRSIPAFYRLTELYVEQGRYEEAFRMSLFGVLTSFTHMNGFLEERLTEFEYNNLADFFSIAVKNYELAEWSVEQGFWRCFFRLADLSGQLFPDNKDFPDQLFLVMALTAPEGYWRQLAVGRM